MDVLTDLGARSYGCPCVHHGPFSNIGTDVDITWHQDDVGRDVGTAPHHRRWYYPVTASGELLLREPLKFGRDFVKVMCVAAIDLTVSS